MSDKNRIQIFDTTLRDGEQAPGAGMTVAEKLQVANLLEAMGVDIIEAGFPISSAGDFEAVNEVSKVVKNSTVAALSRALRKDVDACVEALQPAKRKRIHTFISTSPLHMEHKLRMTPEEVHEAIIDSVSYARRFCDDVEWSCEDGTRSDPDFLCRCFESAIKAGAATVNIADTVGYTMPEEFIGLIETINNRVPNIDKARFSVHCHDDLGLSVANSLAAVSAGVRQVECTVNGIGERAGNASLEEIVMALKVREDFWGMSTNIDPSYLSEVSGLVSAITGFSVAPNKSVVGMNAFAHESGIHQHGMMKHRETYEIMEPTAVGVGKSTIVMGKHSGRHAFRMKLSELGYDVGDNALEDLFIEFKNEADIRKTLTDDDILRLIETHQTIPAVVPQLLSVAIDDAIPGRQIARLNIKNGDQTRNVEADSDCPFQAIANAVLGYYDSDAEIDGYEIHQLSQHGVGYARAMVRFKTVDQNEVGELKDRDAIAAFAKACIAALDRMHA